MPARAAHPRRLRPGRRRGRGHGQRHPRRRPRRRRRPHGRPARGLARDGARHGAQPLLRVGPAGDHDGRHRGRRRRAGPGDRRRCRDDVALGAHRGLGHHRRWQPRPAREVPHRAAGSLRRPHRDARGLHARRRRRVRGHEPGAGAGRGRRRPLRPFAARDHRTRRRGRVRPRRAPACRHHDREARGPAARLRGVGRLGVARGTDLRRAVRRAVPVDQCRRARAPRGQLVGRGRRRRRRGGRVEGVV